MLKYRARMGVMLTSFFLRVIFLTLFLRLTIPTTCPANLRSYGREELTVLRVRRFSIEVVSVGDALNGESSLVSEHCGSDSLTLMPRFAWCAVDSAERDLPTPVDTNADSPRMKSRPLMMTPSFPGRFLRIRLANRDDGMSCRHGRACDPRGAP